MFADDKKRISPFDFEDDRQRPPLTHVAARASRQVTTGQTVRPDLLLKGTQGQAVLK